MDITLEKLHQMEMEQLDMEGGKTPDPDMWRWSPLDIREFDIMLHLAYDAITDGAEVSERQLYFFEAGCGIGTKLYLAKHKYDMIELGWEINPEYLPSCEALGVAAEQRDLRAESPHWEAYDIIFFGCPFKDPMEERAWELSIHESMRPGAVLIGWHRAVEPYTWHKLYRRNFRGVWRKPEPRQDPTEMLSSETIRELHRVVT